MGVLCPVRNICVPGPRITSLARQHLQRAALCLAANLCTKHSPKQRQSRDSWTASRITVGRGRNVIHWITCHELLRFWQWNQLSCEIHLHRSLTAWHIWSQTRRKYTCLSVGNEPALAGLGISGGSAECPFPHPRCHLVCPEENWGVVGQHQPAGGTACSLQIHFIH